MYAFVEISGHQYRVEENQIIVTQKTGHNPGESFSCDRITALCTENGMKVGNPYISGTSIDFEVVEDFKGQKIRGFKYKKRKGYARTFGHRQQYQKIKAVKLPNP